MFSGRIHPLLNLYVKLRESVKSYNNKVPVIGWGLGIGTYNTSSRKYLPDLYKLSKFKFLAVRDADVGLPIARIANARSQSFTDLVFNDELWLNRSDLNFERKERQIGIVLRDWPFEDLGYKEFELAQRLKGTDYQVKFFLFDKSKDDSVLKSMPESLVNDVCVYDPDNFSHFLSRFAENHLIITQRAHGAIVANVLDIPSYCVEIEPKLRNIHKMIPSSSRLIAKDFDVDEIVKLVDNDIATKELHQNCESDFKRNKAIVKEMIDSLMKTVSD